MSDGNQKTEVKGNALNFTFGTSLVALIVPSGAALIGLLGPLSNLPPAVVVAVLGAIAVGLVAAAIVASADVLARAWVTASENTTKAQSAPHLQEEAVRVRVPSRHRDPIPVITAMWDHNESRTWYLVKEPGVTPVWVEHNEVTPD